MRSMASLSGGMQGWGRKSAPGSALRGPVCVPRYGKEAVKTEGKDYSVNPRKGCKYQCRETALLCQQDQRTPLSWRDLLGAEKTADFERVTKYEAGRNTRDREVAKVTFLDNQGEASQKPVRGWNLGAQRLVTISSSRSISAFFAILLLGG